MSKFFEGDIELYLANSYTYTSKDVEYTFHHMSDLKIELNRRFLLKNCSKSIVHLKPGIVTALNLSEILSSVRTTK